MRFLLLVLLSGISFIFLSCENESQPKRTYFSGEVVNPTSELITLERQDTIVDSIYLNDKNKFFYQFPEDAEGLYTFRHAPETQIFYLEKGDSLLVHLNTIEFDESMMYSGEGAAKNNFLMEMFLLNEANNDLLFSYYKIPPSEFAAKTDSIKKQREERLNQLTAKHAFSESFKDLAQKTIDYEFYGLLERYSFLIKKYVEEFQNQFPEDFYAYREQVNFNDKDLQGHYIYRRFLDNFLKNKSLDYCLKNNMDRDCYRLHSINNLQRRIQLADSIFDLPDLKNRFIKTFAQREIIYSEKAAHIDTALQVIKKFDLSKKNKQKLRDLAEIQSSFLTGHDISNKSLLNSKLQKVAFKDISDKPKVLFYWSIYSGEQHKRQHAIVNKLRNKYPEIAFIGINVDAKETDLWQKTIENFDYHEEYEYQIYNVGAKKPLYRNYLNNILFVNGNSIVKDGRLQLDDSYLEDYILQFLNM